MKGHATDTSNVQLRTDNQVLERCWFDAVVIACRKTKILPFHGTRLKSGALKV